MILLWLIGCIAAALLLWALLVWPLARHSSLPRRKKWLLSGIIFIVLVPAGVALYLWVGMPPMVLF